ncbi:MAG: MoaD/ThiS family protein [Alphaproteobacteria bacterium]
MQIKFKLYAGLQEYLPANAVDNAVMLDVEADTSIDQIAARFKLPPELLQLVLVNGVFIPPPARSSHSLAEGDVLAIWPPVAGG